LGCAVRAGCSCANDIVARMQSARRASADFISASVVGSVL
jgi:hypothetical protein